MPCNSSRGTHSIHRHNTEVNTLSLTLFDSKSPNSIAAASILLVCKLVNEKRLERDIAEAASISPTTIRNVYKDLLPHQVRPAHSPGSDPVARCELRVRVCTHACVRVYVCVCESTRVR